MKGGNKMELRTGVRAKAELLVDKTCTAKVWGSGNLDVLSTPRLIALMEQAACEALSGKLEAGKTTVGTSIEMQHTAATPIGLLVWAETELVSVSGRTLEFNIKAFDAAGPIGEAKHTRAVVDVERFMEKTLAKCK